MLKTMIRACALAAAVAALPAQAQFVMFGGGPAPWAQQADGSQTTGFGNMGGSTADGAAVRLDLDLTALWFDQSVPAAQRFIDLSGAVGSAGQTAGYSPFLFNTVSLTSRDGGTLYGQVNANDPAGNGNLSFAFNHLAAGDYKLSFVGVAATPPSSPDFQWAVHEWGYNLKAAASPVSMPVVVSPAPEASDFAMMVTGLAMIGFWLKRRKGQEAVA